MAQMSFWKATLISDGYQRLNVEEQVAIQYIAVTVADLECIDLPEGTFLTEWISGLKPLHPSWDDAFAGLIRKGVIREVRAGVEYQILGWTDWAGTHPFDMPGAIAWGQRPAQHYRDYRTKKATRYNQE